VQQPARRIGGIHMQANSAVLSKSADGS
jgi:hypothetical protein